MIMQIEDYIENDRDRMLEELVEFLKIPSISADPSKNDEVLKAAMWLKSHLEEIGVDHCEIYPTAGHPIVYGQCIIDENLPTILIYGHYDVQPPDPLDLWESPPFEPVIRNTKIHPDGAIFARGACDDKGQLFMHIKALEFYLRQGKPPCNIKLLLEGEEEVGSVHLYDFVDANKDLLSCDTVLISDTAIIANDTPSITTGLRGLCYMQVELTGPNRDLHSGVYGGGVENPINALAKIIAQLKDADNKITIPGFYDKVVELSNEERSLINKAPHSDSEYAQDLGIDAPVGEKGYSTLERTSTRPTLDVNGIWGGYIGEGAKTVLPSKAFAKISMRLVPNQDPKEIETLFTDHLLQNCPRGTTIKIEPHHGGNPAVTPIDAPEYKSASLAMEKTFGKTPIPMRGGGSIPIVSLFENTLDISTVLMGFGLDSDDIHSPNEHYGVFNFFKGIETIAHFYKIYPEQKYAH